MACYGAKSKNEQIRESSTSGGFFSELAINWMLNGGYCIAALYNEDNKIIHHVSNNIADIDLLDNRNMHRVILRESIKS